MKAPAGAGTATAIGRAVATGRATATGSATAAAEMVDMIFLIFTLL